MTAVGFFTLCIAQKEEPQTCTPSHTGTFLEQHRYDLHESYCLLQLLKTHTVWNAW